MTIRAYEAMHKQKILVFQYQHAQNYSKKIKKSHGSPVSPGIPGSPGVPGVPGLNTIL